MGWTLRSGRCGDCAEMFLDSDVEVITDYFNKLHYSSLGEEPR